MTRALDAVIAKLAALPPVEQDRIAQWLLDELRDDEQWTQQFAASRDALSKLAAEARAERSAGRATELDPTNCEIARDAAFLGGVLPVVT